MRVPIWVGILGAAAKALLLVMWRASGSAFLFSLLTTGDPVSFRLAEFGTGIAFDQRRIFPDWPEAMAFNVLLVSGFFLQCIVAGVFVQWLSDRRCHCRTR